MRQAFFLVLAAVIATLTFQLTTLAGNPFFSYGVAFIGYTVAVCLTLVATIGD
jgi:hypothetical protein